MGVFACGCYSKNTCTAFLRENKCEKVVAKQFLDFGLYGVM